MLDNTAYNLAMPTSFFSPLLCLPTFTQCFSHIKLLLDPSHTPCICINCSFNLEFPIFFTMIHFTRLLRLNLLEKPCSPSICHINIIYIFLCFFFALDLKQFEFQLYHLSQKHMLLSIVSKNSMHSIMFQTVVYSNFSSLGVSFLLCGCGRCCY